MKEFVILCSCILSMAFSKNSYGTSYGNYPNYQTINIKAPYPPKINYPQKPVQYLPVKPKMPQPPYTPEIVRPNQPYINYPVSPKNPSMYQPIYPQIPTVVRPQKPAIYYPEQPYHPQKPVIYEPVLPNPEKPILHYPEAPYPASKPNLYEPVYPESPVLPQPSKPVFSTSYALDKPNIYSSQVPYGDEPIKPYLPSITYGDEYDHNEVLTYETDLYPSYRELQMSEYLAHAEKDEDEKENVESEEKIQDCCEETEGSNASNDATIQLV
ncbi:adhesive plaque matrix protein-like [Artemia franciscana]|uniref:adhesive plaque matrix protein-like n=1 Tax=Artemia franciscana TaxID=6661 RepID=UPI0032DA38E8